MTVLLLPAGVSFLLLPSLVVFFRLVARVWTIGLCVHACLSVDPRFLSLTHSWSSCFVAFFPRRYYRRQVEMMRCLSTRLDRDRPPRPRHPCPRHPPLRPTRWDDKTVLLGGGKVHQSGVCNAQSGGPVEHVNTFKCLQASPHAPNFDSNLGLFPVRQPYKSEGCFVDNDGGERVMERFAPGFDKNTKMSAEVRYQLLSRSHFDRWSETPGVTTRGGVWRTHVHAISF